MAVLRPIPRRSFENTPASHKSSVPPLPSPENTNSEALDAKLYGASQPCRTRSVLNLTSSTLFGIYSPTGYEVSREEPTTPWGTGAQTPVQKYSADGPPPQFGEHWHEALSRAPFDRRKQRLWGRSLSLLLQKTLLFATGVAYGTLISHLHDNQNLTPVKVDAFNQQSWTYVLFWGLAGAALGTLQLWVDAVWSISMTSTENFSSLVRRKGSTSSIDEDVNCERPSSGADWTTVVRSVGAFIGIAFAIRKLSWQSTLQLSSTLALVNPLLWYLIDKSKPGFILSAVVSIVGTFALLEINPDMVPSPAIGQQKATFSNISSDGIQVSDSISPESIAVWTWIASVLFCSCVCFGNIGRKLALRQESAVS